MARRPIRVVVFDIGETLLDETFAWRGWSEHLGVSLETFRAAFDAAIEAGEHHHRALERLKPGFNLEAERAERRARGATVTPTASDLYPDAVPCLRLLQQRGFRIGIAANQPPGRVPEVLGLLGVTPDFAGSSAEWGVEKPPQNSSRECRLSRPHPRRASLTSATASTMMCCRRVRLGWSAYS